MSPNDIQFSTPIDDPWYSIHRKLEFIPAAGGAPRELYYRDDPMRVIGCVAKYQYCNPNLTSNSTCTPLTGAYPARAAATHL
jgi:hypothetical protein